MTTGVPDKLPRLESCFLAADQGELLLTTWLPAEGPPDRWLLLVPPFAEEMNKSRRMFAMLGRRAAATGCGVLLVDLSGTGDSWGDFRDARYAGWLADLQQAVRWAAERGGPVTAVAGLRFGALLAMELSGIVPTVAQALLWQPSLAGADVLTQFLRLKTAAGLTGSGDPADTQVNIRARLAGGESVEIAGYELTPELYAAIGSLKLIDLVPDRPLRVDWFHLARQPAEQVPDTIAAAAAQVSARGATVQTHAVQGDAFWSTVEIAVCDDLVARTVACLAS